MDDWLRCILRKSDRQKGRDLFWKESCPPVKVRLRSYRHVVGFKEYKNGIGPSLITISVTKVVYNLRQTCLLQPH